MGEKGAAVGVVQADDIADGMQCMDHPYRSNPGGICAFCLQEKLGKLVTSSKLTGPFFPFQPPLSASSSSSPAAAAAAASSSSLGSVEAPAGGIVVSGPSRTGNGRARIPILSVGSHRKKKIGGGTGGGGGGGSGSGSSISSRKVAASAVAACTSSSLAAAPAAAGNNAAVVMKRSKSVASRPGADGGARAGAESLAMDSPRKKSFWSFLYPSSSSSSSTATSSSTSNNNCNNNRRKSTSSLSGGGGGEREGNKQQQSAPIDDNDGGSKTAAPRRSEHAAGEAAESPMTRSHAVASSFGRKVERSRSVGCGSRSFSGDFLERISTGFGDCTLRRVESHRESKPKVSLRLEDDDERQRRRMKERIKCGGLFGGFGIALASSFWLSAAVDDDFDNSSRITSATPGAAAAVGGGGGHSAAGTPHGRARYWGWAFASPMRAFRPTVSSKSLYAVSSHANASAAATNAISAINASNKLVH